MAMFSQYQGGDAFNVAGNMDAVLKQQQATAQSMLDAVEKFNSAQSEMDVLKSTTASILSQYGVDENGVPSDAAPKYVHDLYKNIKKEGTIHGMSRSNLISALKGYEAGVAVEEQRLKVQSAQQTATINDLAIAEARRKAEEAKKIADAHRIAWETSQGGGSTEAMPSGPSVTDVPRGISMGDVEWSGGAPRSTPVPSSVAPNATSVPTPRGTATTAQPAPQTESNGLANKETLSQSELRAKLEALRTRLGEIENPPKSFLNEYGEIINQLIPKGGLAPNPIMNALLTNEYSPARMAFDFAKDALNKPTPETAARIEKAKKENDAVKEAEKNKLKTAIKEIEAQLPPEPKIKSASLEEASARLQAVKQKQKDIEVGKKLETLEGKQRDKYAKEQGLEKRVYLNPDGWTKSELSFQIQKTEKQLELAKKTRVAILNGDISNKRGELSGEEADIHAFAATAWKEFRSKYATNLDGTMKTPSNKEYDSKGGLLFDGMEFWTNEWVKSYEKNGRDFKNAFSEKTNNDSVEGTPKYNTTYFKAGSTTPVFQNGKAIIPEEPVAETAPAVAPATTASVVPSSIAPNATSAPIKPATTQPLVAMPQKPAQPVAGADTIAPPEKTQQDQITQEYGVVTSRLKALGSVPMNWSEETFRQMRGYPPKVQISRQGGVTLVGIGGNWQVMKGESMSPSEMATMEKNAVWKASIRTDNMTSEKWRFRGDIKVDNSTEAGKVKREVLDTINAINALDRLIELGRNTSKWDSMLPTEKSGIIIGITNAVQAAGRTEVAGSGAFSEQDAKKLESVVPDMATMSGSMFRDTAIARLLEFRGRMVAKVNGIAGAYQFEVTESANTGLTPEQTAIGRNVYQTAIAQGVPPEQAQRMAIEAIQQQSK
jgi:hypothetical protein